MSGHLEYAVEMTAVRVSEVVPDQTLPRRRTAPAVQDSKKNKRLQAELLKGYGYFKGGIERPSGKKPAQSLPAPPIRQTWQPDPQQVAMMNLHNHPAAGVAQNWPQAMPPVGFAITGPAPMQSQMWQVQQQSWPAVNAVQPYYNANSNMQMVNAAYHIPSGLPNTMQPSSAWHNSSLPIPPAQPAYPQQMRPVEPNTSPDRGQFRRVWTLPQDFQEDAPGNAASHAGTTPSPRMEPTQSTEYPGFRAGVTSIPGTVILSDCPRCGHPEESDGHLQTCARQPNSA